MLKSIYENGLTYPSLLLGFGLCLAFGLIIACFYSWKHKTSRSFALTLAALPLITCAVILVVNDNLGAGIAVAGSFSMIRFRSVQGSGKEILAVFLTAALGMCMGAGYALMAATLCGMYMLASFLPGLIKLGSDSESQKELRISVPEALEYDGLFDDLLKKYFSSCELERVRTAEMGTVYQLTYRVVPVKSGVDKAFMDELRQRNGNLPVSLGKVPDGANEI